jgi:predicted transcriptional regulator
LAGKYSLSTKLEVFSNKAASLNRLIFELLYPKKELAIYETYLEIRRIKGLRHTKYQTVHRRMKNLERQRWIVKKGSKKTQPGTNAPLYQLSKRAVAALELDKVNMNKFLMDANDELVEEITRILAYFRESSNKTNTQIKYSPKL